MFGSLRSICIALLAMTLGVSHACACVHELSSGGGPVLSGHHMHGGSHEGGGAGHDLHGHGHGSEAIHADACGAQSPACDHAPDASAVVVSAKSEVGTQLVQLAAFAAPAPVAFVDRVALRSVGQTGPPVWWRSPVAETPVSLRVRLLV